LFQVQIDAKEQGWSRTDRASISGKQSNQASITEEAVEEPCDILSVNPGKDKGRFSDAWLLDSGCTYHMCPKKEWFITYEPFEGGTVLMRNDVACKTVGIGSICMKMFDRQVRTLKNVRHVPDLRKNLLSLGAMEAQGCKFSSTDGALKVIKGSMMILKAEHTANLYK